MKKSKENPICANCTHCVERTPSQIKTSAALWKCNAPSRPDHPISGTVLPVYCDSLNKGGECSYFEALSPKKWPKEEKKPFVPYAAFGKYSRRVRKVVDEVVDEDDARLRCADSSDYGGTVSSENLTRIGNPDEALRILLDLTGQKSMVEKIKEHCTAREAICMMEHRAGSGERFENFASSYRVILGSIADLEAKAKKE